MTRRVFLRRLETLERKHLPEVTDWRSLGSRKRFYEREGISLLALGDVREDEGATPPREPKPTAAQTSAKSWRCDTPPTTRQPPSGGSQA